MFDVADVQTSTVRSKSGRRRIAERHQDLAVVADQLGGNADAARTIADIAGNLEATAATTRERY
jgi:hypothetical protein